MLLCSDLTHRQPHRSSCATHSIKRDAELALMDDNRRSRIHAQRAVAARCCLSCCVKALLRSSWRARRCTRQRLVPATAVRTRKPIASRKYDDSRNASRSPSTVRGSAHRVPEGFANESYGRAAVYPSGRNALKDVRRRSYRTKASTVHSLASANSSYTCGCPSMFVEGAVDTPRITKEGSSK